MCRKHKLHLLDRNLTDEEREAEAEGRLHPNETVAVRDLRRTVDEASADPSGWKEETAYMMKGGIGNF